MQEGLKINVCLFDNMGWGCIENLQNNQGTDTFGTVFRARNPKTGYAGRGGDRCGLCQDRRGLRCKGLHLPHLGGAARRTGRRSYQDRACLFDIKVLPKTMTPGFESWWRVGVAEVSKSETVARRLCGYADEYRQDF